MQNRGGGGACCGSNGVMPSYPSVFGFGEHRDGFAVPVLNERAVRAAAGLLFVAAFAAFMNAWLLGHFRPTRVFVVAFLIDFTLRLFVNPGYAPSLIIGQWIVRRQQPEWVGAPQKRFAWAIGFVLAATMAWLVVVREVIGPLNVIVCAICLVLLFCESAFGICLGCWVYHALRPGAAQLCPGEACERPPEPGAGGTWREGSVVLVTALLVAAWARQLPTDESRPAVTPAPAASAPDAAEAERCRVPEFAKAMGHEAMWKLHNQCP
jgi:Domain of unknown function (DUF4395)